MRLAPVVDACFHNTVAGQYKVKQGIKMGGMIMKNQVTELVQNDKFNVFKG